ncbi:RNA-binding protein [Vibrio breoganii]|uniref:ASCH domain-containing protein n=1 Tax=Vibrio breoganii TaxID=553239 RepID=UPI000C821B8A|nr:ASCH domain-containing protein [Vibrio breoganii]PMM11585.1 RNA-binding protein [Vibrio breoganii]
MTTKHEQLLESYLSTLSETERKNIATINADHFCADEFNANECAKLVNEGKKRATCSLKVGYEKENAPLPKQSDLTIVLDWSQNPVCIIKTHKVETKPFKEIDAEFAAMEGEDDGSFKWWQREHAHFFSEYAKEISVSFNEDSEIVLEYFEKVYPIE